MNPRCRIEEGRYQRAEAGDVIGVRMGDENSAKRRSCFPDHFDQGPGVFQRSLRVEHDQTPVPMMRLNVLLKLASDS